MAHIRKLDMCHRFSVQRTLPKFVRIHLSKILYKKTNLRYSVSNFSPRPLTSHGWYAHLGAFCFMEETTMAEKDFKSIAEQRALLASRGLTIEENSAAEEFLLHNNWLRSRSVCATPLSRSSSRTQKKCFITGGCPNGSEKKAIWRTPVLTGRMSSKKWWLCLGSTDKFSAAILVYLFCPAYFYRSTLCRFW